MRSPLVALSLLLALGCGASGTHSGAGNVVAIDEAALRVTLAHDDIPGLMPAMTMAFPVASAAVLAGVSVGQRVRFELSRRENDLVLVRLVPAGVATGGRPGIHDHTPHHGGVVTMLGMRHVEAVAEPGGRVRVYLTDVWRRPLPLANVGGTATLELPAGPQTLRLETRDGVLEASGPPLAGRNVRAHVQLVAEGRRLDAYFVVPLASDVAGVAELPPAGCIAPAATEGPGRAPRCTMRFPRPVTASAPLPDGRTA
ncbi:MAG TPA: copper-binding protein, partial [Candidatus Binatia bacterium]|nr:copper-binding protein [Candidatus Binatia bacterium]